MLTWLPSRVCRVLPIAEHRHRRPPGYRHQQIVSRPSSTFLRYRPLISRVREADLTDADFFLEPLDSSLFPNIPSSVEVHNGFASDQARYTTRPSLLALFRIPTKHSQDRDYDPLLRQAGTLRARRVIRHSGRPLSRCGTLTPRRRLPPSPTQREYECASGWIWDASGRESGLCGLGRRQPRRTCDAHKQQGGPYPDLARHVFGLPPSLGRGPHHGLRYMGKLPR